MVGQGLTLDLNHDGIADFKIEPMAQRSAIFVVLAVSLGTNRVWGGANAQASELAAGYRVGPNSAKFQKGTTFSSEVGPAKILYACADSSGFITCDGPWTKGSGGFLGLKFLIKGKVHYGWARITITVSNQKKFNLILDGYAYETIPNKPIITGKTKGLDDADSIQQLGTTSVPNEATERASLGLLAMGSPGLSIWRRREFVEPRQ